MKIYFILLYVRKAKEGGETLRGQWGLARVAYIIHKSQNIVSTFSLAPSSSCANRKIKRGASGRSCRIPILSFFFFYTAYCKLFPSKRGEKGESSLLPKGFCEFNRCQSRTWRGENKKKKTQFFRSTVPIKRNQLKFPLAFSRWMGKVNGKRTGKGIGYPSVSTYSFRSPHFFPLFLTWKWRRSRAVASIMSAFIHFPQPNPELVRLIQTLARLYI